MRIRPVEIRFPGTHQGFAHGFARLRRALDRETLDSRVRYNCELIFEEIVANIVGHGAVNSRAPAVHVTLESGSNSIVLTFEDDGLPFDPRRRPEAAPVKSLQDAPIGGFGLMLVHRAASSLGYLRTVEERNRLTVTIRRRLDASRPPDSPALP